VASSSSSTPPLLFLSLLLSSSPLLPLLPLLLLYGHWSIRRSNVPHWWKQKDSDGSIAADDGAAVVQTVCEPNKKRRVFLPCVCVCVSRQTRDCGGRQTDTRTDRHDPLGSPSAAPTGKTSLGLRSRHVTFSQIWLGGLLLRSRAVGNTAACAWFRCLPPTLAVGEEEEGGGVGCDRIRRKSYESIIDKVCCTYKELDSHNNKHRIKQDK